MIVTPLLLRGVVILLAALVMVADSHRIHKHHHTHLPVLDYEAQSDTVKLDVSERA